MYDSVDFQQRSSEGRWWALNPRRVSIDIVADDAAWENAAEAARRAGTTIGTWVCDKIEQTYIDYATAGQLPVLRPEDSPPLEHKHIRADFAVRSMACEMAQAAGASVSRMIRAIIADALLQGESEND